MSGNQVFSTLERKDGILASLPALHTPVRRAVESLTRRNLAGARAELLNEALQHCTVLLYEVDASGRLCNVDDDTGRVLLPLPWGRLGHQKWGLRYTEHVVLRAIMRAHHTVHDSGKRPAVYLYDEGSRTWLLNLVDFPDVDAAMQRIEATPITPAQWRHYVERR